MELGRGQITRFGDQEALCIVQTRLEGGRTGNAQQNLERVRIQICKVCKLHPEEAIASNQLKCAENKHTKRKYQDNLITRTVELSSRSRQTSTYIYI